jgi:hypothetical protein
MGLHALVLCPTGPLVHQYRLLLPDSERIVVETIHSAMRISPHSADVVEHAPPSRLNRYDLILLDEGSQVVSKKKKIYIYVYMNIYIYIYIYEKLYKMRSHNNIHRLIL